MLLTSKITQYLTKNKGLLGIFPAFLFVLIFFVGGFLQSLCSSLGLGNQMGMDGHGFGWVYQEIMTPYYLQAFGVTVLMAAVISVLAGVIGIIAALMLATLSTKWKWLHIVFQLPVGVPHLLSAYMLTQVLMQTGWFSRIAFHLGWIDRFERFPSMIHDTWGIGFILAYLWKEIPFIVLLIAPFIAKLMAEWKETSIMLGATPFQTVRWVIIPILMPLWVGGMWVTFAFALGAYEIPALLARTSFRFIPVLAWQEYTQFGLERQPIAIALNMVLALVSFIIGLILIYLQKKWYGEGRRMWNR
jgi:putative spermidine/putrescine transport system permease protein